MSKFKTSASAKADYSPSKSRDAALELSINSRNVPTVLQYKNSNPEGDHVTSIRLVEEGLYRRLNYIKTGEVEGLSELENRSSLRSRRSNLYDYVSAIAILDPKRKDQMYVVVDEVLSSYNQQRYSKRAIKQTAESLHADPNLTGASYEESLKGLQSKFRENGEKIRGVFSEVSRMVVTFYNRVPRAQYHNITGFTEGGGNIKSSVGTMQEVMNWCYSKREPVGSAVVSAKREQVVNCINAFIHYPEITDQAALLQHQNLNLIEKKGKHNLPRDNEKSTLIETLSKHFHIFTSAYPEVSYFNQNSELVDGFIDKFIGKGTPKPNWPKFANDINLQEIKVGVRAGVARLSNEFAVGHYNQWKATRKAVGYDLDSSGDEEITTKPRVKISKPKYYLL